MYLKLNIQKIYTFQRRRTPFNTVHFLFKSWMFLPVMWDFLKHWNWQFCMGTSRRN